ncbi:hypothetical protein LT85_1000 [Collimonas arenae]|uniref:Uncharacterized protein n=1 Tax=Collimonas arenae TaxID=279058 RepID=A0A0A1F621_9BURK|nr:hypothetical protein [Collimonas arenae]AIY40158.1 hypothetical protein LT85_1000 [Collimonas arenae]
MAKHIYTVKGSGDFPIDMLRYDECWPDQPADAEAIAPGNREIRYIKLLSDRYPTVHRWESFCWTVSAID